MKYVHKFLRDDDGQDLIECTLLIALTALAAAALFLGAGIGIKAIWPTSNTQLATAGNQGPAQWW
jgi:Flp pilus assembly pilin Flp